MGISVSFQEKVIQGLKTKITYLKPKIKKCSVWLETNQSTWTKIFLTSCVVAIIIDPLFFHVPLVNEDMKCVRMDQNLKIVALVFRSFTDIFGILDIGFKLGTLAIRESNTFVLKSSIFSVVIDILAILPLPQVLILVVNAKMWSARKYWTTVRMLNFVVLSQNLPRILQIYKLCMELRWNYDSVTGHVWLKGAFNLFLYVVASHIFGACWYYFSIQRVTTCWQRACRSHEGCVPDAFSCHVKTSSSDSTFNVVDFCPVNPPNATIFDFGIFVDALGSGLVGRTDFPIKFLQCFWWGLRNISSYGQNLEISSDLLETCFAILISITGLLLFSYLIGNLQIYMQLETMKSNERRAETMKMIKDRKIDSYINYIYDGNEIKYDKSFMKNVIMREQRHALNHEEDIDLANLLAYLKGRISERAEMKGPLPLLEEVAELENYIKDWRDLQEKHKREGRAQSWILDNEIPEDIKNLVAEYLSRKLKDDDVNVVNVLSTLPTELGTQMKAHLCLPILQKLMNREIDMFVETIYHLKPVVYKENTYIISAGEPLDFILLITQGVAWSFDSARTEAAPLERNCYFGEELLHWIRLGKEPNKFPISKKSLKSHTNIEGFLIKIVDLHKIFNPDGLPGSSILNSCLEKSIRSAIKRALNKVGPKRNEDPGQTHERGGGTEFV